MNLSKLTERHPGGRPGKFTPQTIRTLLRCVRRGMPMSLAASAAGISHQSIINWKKASPRFAEAVEQSRAKGLAAKLAIITSAAKTDWRAAAWYAEHIFPEHFAKSRIELSGPDGSPVAGIVAVMLPPKADTNGNGSHALPVVTVAPALAERTHGNGD